ncbi:hypothetical protein Aperf_G00000086665 [Anoplocephala perfoliata]
MSSSRMYRVNPFKGEVNILKSVLFRRSAAAAVACESDILIFGGYDSTNNTDLNTCEKFVPSSEMLENIPAMPTARDGTGVVHIPGIGDLFVGGSIGKESLNIVELFQIGSSPAENDRIWCKLAPLLYPRRFPAIEFFEVGVYVVGDNSTEIQTAEMISVRDE